MEIKLCYKVYPFRITLGACKEFYDNTGKDLQHVLLKYISACAESREMALLERMNHFLSVESFEVCAHAIHALVRTENTHIPLNEIRDGMFRVSWLPSERSDELSEPWVMVMLDIATQVNGYFQQNIPVKKKDTEAKKPSSKKSSLTTSDSGNEQ